MQGVNGHVLIAESDPKWAGQMACFLSEHVPVRLARDLSSAETALGCEAILAAIVAVQLRNRNGLDLVEVARLERPSLALLVLGDSFHPADINRAFQLNVAMLCKTHPAADTLESLLGFVREVSGVYTAIHKAIDLTLSDISATPAEGRLLHVFMSGCPRGDLGWKLGISDNTVKAHIRGLLRKAGAFSLRELRAAILKNADQNITPPG